MNISSDDRRLACFNIFPVTPGQVNIVRLYPGKVCGWHRHLRQTDYYFCVSGVVKVGRMRPEAEPEWSVLDAHNPATATIDPGTWHGYTAVGGPAILLQYLDRKYDPTDEERMAAGPEWA